MLDEKKGDKEFQESEERFRQLFELSPIGKSMTGIDGSLHVNKAFCDMVGYSEEEIKSMKWQDITHPDDISASADFIKSIIEGTVSYGRIEKRFIHKSGGIIWADVSTNLYRKDGKPQYFITSAINITDRRQTEIMLKESEEKYRALVEVSSDAIFINQQNRITYLNPAALRLFGANDQEQLIGESPFTLFDPDFHHAIGVRIDEMFEREIAVPIIEERIIKLDGTKVDVEVTATSFKLQGELAIHVVLRDVTERKQAERQIVSFNEELEKLVQLRTAELNESIAELEEQTRVFVGREMRIIELKDRVEELERQLKEKANF